jgi:Ca2+-binding RTX toxin-like protein
MAVFKGQPGIDNHFQGFYGVGDIFEFNVSDLTGSDHVDGRLGFDLLKLLSAGTVSASAFSNIKNIDIIQFDYADTSVIFDDAFFSKNGDYHTPGHNYGLLQVAGTGGSDHVDASGTTITDYYLLMQTQGGDDELLGGLGTETIVVQGSPAGDIISGGGGANLDTLQFTNVSTILSAEFSGIRGIERLVFGNNDTTIYLTNALVGSAYASTLKIYSASGNDYLNGGNVTNSSYRLEFNSLDGEDVLIGSVGNDTFNFSDGNLNALDVVEGKGGIDTLTLFNFNSVGAGDLIGVSKIEEIVLSSRNTTLIIDNSFILRNPGFIAINGMSGHNAVDASAVTATTGGLVVTAGRGIDTFRGGSGADTFIFDGGTYNDLVDGGQGSNIDTLKFTTAVRLGITGFANIAEIERVELADGANHIWVNNRVVAASRGLEITIVGGKDGDALSAWDVTLAGGRVALYGGEGEDILDGSNGADLLEGGADNDVLTGRGGANVMTGGRGADIFNFIARNGVADSVTDFAAISDTLQFRFSAFDFNGTGFDDRMVAASAAIDITGADLVIYSGAFLNSASDAKTYLRKAVGGTANEGMFIAGTNSIGQTVLFHAVDASATVSTNIDFIGTLGTLSSAVSLQLSDFAFV